MSAKDGASATNTKNKNHFKVIIIGAGVAGLTAANHLCSNGVTDFKILEARNRIGGRIICIDIGSHRIELGATWVHGILGNPIFEFAMQHNLLDVLHTTPQNRKVIALVENGKQIPFEMLQEIYEAYLIFLRRCEEYFLCTYAPPDDCFSVGAHIKLEIDLYLKSIENKEDKQLREMIFSCLLKRETCISGCHSMNEIDLLELGSYTELQGGNIILPNGYSSILAPLKNSLPPDSILLNCPVKTIKWKRKKAPVTSPGGLNEIPEEEDEDGNDSDKTITDEPKSPQYDGSVQIVCDTNEVFYADHVICTIPLGVLKANAKLFDPPLPEYKQESIDRLLFGTVNKIYLEYERPFLSQDISEIMLLWEEDLSPSAEPTDEQVKEFWATVEISNVLKKGEIDTWLTLEQAKHGMVHLRLTWMQLSNDRNDLKAALAETQMLRVTDMSTALLTVFIDSARNLPHARQASNPDPCLILSVNKKTEQTSVQMRTDSPVWEQGFTFLVANPENDTLQIKLIDQKTTNEIGKYTYIIAHLMEKEGMEILPEPFQLQKSGPESKIVMALSLRILKHSQPIEEEEVKEPTVAEAEDVAPSTLKKQDSRVSHTSINADAGTLEEPLVASTVSSSLSAIPPSPTLSNKSASSSLGRNPSIKSFKDDSGPLGAINLTVQYSVQRQRLTVIVHRIKNIPLKDPSNIPDPYVKLYLLPSRSKESKRKTVVVKDNCDPVYDATFDYLISTAELNSSQLEVTVATDKLIGSPILGMLKIALNDPEISGAGKNAWWNLLPEFKSTDL